jgi:hypothetical protein
MGAPNGRGVGCERCRCWAVPRPASANACKTGHLFAGSGRPYAHENRARKWERRVEGMGAPIGRDGCLQRKEWERRVEFYGCLQRKEWERRVEFYGCLQWKQTEGFTCKMGAFLRRRSGSVCSVMWCLMFLYV